MLTIQDFYYKVTKVWEKGKVNHPDDPGGATNDGVATHFITSFSLRADGASFLRSMGVEPSYIMGYANAKAKEKTKIFDPGLLMSLSPQQCGDILIYEFWSKEKLEILPCRLSAFATFDFSVNSGTSRGKRYLQMAANFFPSTRPALGEDGLFGPKTYMRLEDFNSHRADLDLSCKLCDMRMDFLQSLPTFPRFGKGWTNRVSALRAYLKGAA